MWIRILFFILLCQSSLFAAPGDLDTSFGSEGSIITLMGYSGQANSVAIQSDGKIVVVGIGYDGSTKNDFALIRYNPDGSFDTDFGDDGKVTTPVGIYSAGAYSTEIQSDGKIVVVGQSDGNFALARYNNNGDLDASFGTDGIVITDINSSRSDAAYGVAIQIIDSETKIVAAGNDGSNFALARYNNNGDLDTSFGTDGIVITDMNGTSTAYDVTIQIIDSETKIVAAGFASGSGRDFALARYNSNGSLDAGFGTSSTLPGTVITDIGGYNDVAESIAIQSDGKIVTAGYSNNNGSDNDFALVRYNSNGSLDAGFGIVTTPVGDGNDAAYSVAIHNDGNIIAAGTSSEGYYSYFTLVCYNQNGTLNTNFGTDGKVVTQTGNYGYANSVVIQSDGKIVAAGGWSSNGGRYYFATVRYLGTSETSTATLAPIYYLLQ